MERYWIGEDACHVVRDWPILVVVAGVADLRVILVQESAPRVKRVLMGI